MEITQGQFFYTTLEVEQSIFYEEVHIGTPYKYDTAVMPEGTYRVICGDIFMVTEQNSVRTGGLYEGIGK